jgi:hypothetical protein
VTQVAAAERTPASAGGKGAAPGCKAVQASDPVWYGLIGFGLYQVTIALVMAVDPGAFFDLVGPFGARNDHYVVDVATFELPLGVALLAATRLRSWRVPVLAFAALHWALHALNHLADISAADPGWIGVFDFLALTAGAAALTWLCVLAVRAERWATR